MRKNEDRRVVSMEAGDASALDVLPGFIVDEKIDPGTCGVWVSIIADRDQGGVSVPANLLNIVSLTNCGLDVSFVACLAEEN